MKDMKELVLSEENYTQERELVVEPYLKKRMTEHYLERKPRRKLYTVSYRADHPKAVVVISHGFSESVKKYEEPIYYFLQQGYHVVMADHCGHGYSYRMVKDPSLVHVDHYTRYVKDLIYVIRYAKKEYAGLPLVLFGHSMGGGIAAETASQIPEEVDILLLSSPMIRPLTGGFPWPLVLAVSEAMCLSGKGNTYAMGQKPFADEETFETSACLSRSRFSYYYDNVKRKNRRYQTCAASYAWLRESLRMSCHLLMTAWRKLTMPVLLTQAGKDTYVSNKAQSDLIRKIQKKGNTHAELLYFQDAKHECYNGYDRLVKNYWNQVFEYLERKLQCKCTDSAK